MRYAEIAPMYRRERSGELYGLVRTLGFHLADPHILCQRDRVGEDLDQVLDFVQHVMRTLGLDGDCSFRTSLHEPGDPRYAGVEEMWERGLDLGPHTNLPQRGDGGQSPTTTWQ